MSLATVEPVGSVRVVESGEGAVIRDRRMKLGLSVKALAGLAGVDRGRLAAIEDGAQARSGTYGAIHAALDKLEAEMSGPYDPPAAIPDPSGRTVTFHVEGNFGIKATVQGPVENIEELRLQVQELIRVMGNDKGNDKGKPGRASAH